MAPDASPMRDLQEQIVSRPEELAVCCAYLASQAHFGFDTEFVGEDSYHPHLCLVQVATDERLILIDPQTVGPLDAFWKLVTDPARVVVVHAGREEVRLCHLWTGQIPGNLFDLQIAAGLVGLAYPLGHGALVGQLLGVQLAKGATRTEWRSRPLTRAQIRYALDDVRYLLPLWERLSGRLQEQRRTEWAREEFGRLADNATRGEAAPGAAERWRKLRGLGALDRKRLAVARELYLWREETAARTNRPARSVCRDDLIVEIARCSPTRAGDLEVIRGLPRRHVEAVLETVARARALAPEHYPLLAEREQDPPQVGLVSSVLLAVLGDLCARRQLASNLVASSQDVKLLVRARSQTGAAEDWLPPESLLSQGWRSRFVLPELLAVLEGRRSLRVVDPGAETPFELEDWCRDHGSRTTDH